MRQHPTHEARRIKYACFACRRTFKFVERDDMDYAGGAPLIVRPGYHRLRAVWDAYARLAGRKSQRGEREDEQFEEVKRREQAHLEALFDGGGKIKNSRLGRGRDGNEDEDEDEDEEVIEEMKKYAPDLWWTPLKPSCPSCGTPGRQVSPTFMPPPQRNVHAWAKLEKTVETAEEYKSATSKAIKDEKNAEASRAFSQGYRMTERVDERWRRIRVLKKAVALGVRTSEEERRLEVIRSMRKPDKPKFGMEYPWVVVV